MAGLSLQPSPSALPAPLWADALPGPPPGAPPAAPRPLLENTEFLVACGLMVVVLFGGAAVLSYFDRRRKRDAAAKLESVGLLEHYRELFENGELTESEYTRIRERVAGRMKQEVGLPSVVPKPPVPPPPTAPDPPTPPAR